MHVNTKVFHPTSIIEIHRVSTNVAPPFEQAQTTVEIYYAQIWKEVRRSKRGSIEPPTIAFIRSLLNDMCTLHQPLKAIRNHQFFVRSSIDCQLSLFLSVSVSFFLSVSVSRLDVVEGSINTKLRLIQVHHR